MNLYGFAGGDPINFSDPFGLSPTECPPCDGGVLGGVGGAVGGAAGAATALASAQSNSDVIAAGLNAAFDAVRDKLQIKFVTYTRAGPDGVYSGRTSGVGDPQGIVNARAARHPDRLQGYGPAILDTWATGPQGYIAIRGREQQLIDAHGGARSEGGTSANLIRGVNRTVYPIFNAAATAMFGPLPPR